MRKEIERLLYHQKHAHKAWLNKVFLTGIEASEETSQLVWELLVAFGEGIEDFDKVAEDVHKIACELAGKALLDTPIDMVYKYYRDYLLDAMLNYTGEGHPKLTRAMVSFTNVISSAFCEANSNQLKKTIRLRRTERFNQELTVAKKIQSHLLPKVIPTVIGFDFAGLLIPAAEIGGDYWSVKFHPKDNIVTLKLADITGHGIAAATLVAAVKFISGGYYKGAQSAADVMQQTNRVLTIETPHEIMVSMVYAWLRPDTYEITIVNAGHAPAFICTKDECIDMPLTGPLMGLTEKATYDEVTYTLAKDDLVFFGSDGIIEAGAGERFGIDRLKALVLENKHLSANEIAQMVVKSVTDFAGQPQDDISLQITKVVGEAPAVSATAKPRKGNRKTRDY